MTTDVMDFMAALPRALRDIMTAALSQVAREGLAGDHHFYITINTRHPGVVLPASLRALYPETITIVLQHEFWDLLVTDEGFSISLAFNGVPQNLRVPYDAVHGFADPSINFGVQFSPAVPAAPPAADAPDDGPGDDGPKDDTKGDDRVVTLDTFRKK